MLFVGLSLIAGIGLLILIVWVLHRYQQKENEESVDRRVPLPPIELRETHDEELTDPEDILVLHLPVKLNRLRFPQSLLR